MEQAMRDGEGCNIEGWIEVLRVAGNFHISVHSQVRSAKLAMPTRAVLHNDDPCSPEHMAACCKPGSDSTLRHSRQDFMLLGRAQADLAAMRQHQLTSGGNLNLMVRQLAVLASSVMLS